MQRRGTRVLFCAVSQFPCKLACQTAVRTREFRGTAVGRRQTRFLQGVQLFSQRQLIPAPADGSRKFGQGPHARKDNVGSLMMHSLGQSAVTAPTSVSPTQHWSVQNTI